MPEAFENRDVKSLTLKGSESITNINDGPSFELYVIKNSLEINPIIQNAGALREEAESQGGVCSIYFGVYESGTEIQAYLESIVQSITNSCDVKVCAFIEEGVSDCKPLRNVTNDDIVEFRDCDCDVVIHLIDDKTEKDNIIENIFSMTTVSYDVNGNENDILLIGIFEDNAATGTAEVRDFFGIPINTPSVHRAVPVFSTLDSLTDNMGEALMRVDGISNATVEASYEESSIFTFTVDITVGMELSVEFSEGLELGNFVGIEVESSNLSLDGSFRILNEFGVRLNSAETGTNGETGYSFANGQFLIEADINVEGNAVIRANVLSFPIDSTLSTELSGDLRLSANRAGNYLPVGEMLEGIGQVLERNSNDFAAQAFVIFDGFFEAEVVIQENAIRARGGFKDPFELNLLNPAAPGPIILFEVGVPDSGRFTIPVNDFLTINFGFNFGDGDRQLSLGAHFSFDTDDG
jgi:hypothetical protein